MKRSSEKQLRYLPILLVAMFALIFVDSLRIPSNESQLDVVGFASLPVLHGGRLKPIDSVARASLLMLSGKQTVHFKNQKLSAAEWLLNVMYRPTRAHALPVFQINDPDVLGLMGFEQSTNRFYSYNDLSSHLHDIEMQIQTANAVPSENRNRFERAIMALGNQLTLYQKLLNTLQMSGDEHAREELNHFSSIVTPVLEAHMKNPTKVNQEQLQMLRAHVEQYRFIDQMAEFFPIPLHIDTAGDNGWVSMGAAILDRQSASDFHPAITAYTDMGDAYRNVDPITFNQALERHKQWLHENARPNQKILYEVIFNHAVVFMQALTLYALVFLLVALSWMIWPDMLNRSAYALLLFAFLIHTVGLISRMILQGRPPVTNLYSSAVFVGWAAVFFGIFLERIFRRGFAMAVAALIGFVTLIIAHHLSAQGDTLEMMRAVLDSNFWLATHVVCITIGYSSTFLSGMLGVLYIVRRAFDKSFSGDAPDVLYRMTYGVICFSALFSFLGTILGGIWADQSWGRFWGWDPKENGALMIVLWNVFILHARMAGLAKTRGFMAMAVFGNVVTAFSWFGVNMLGIGLHSYGFMDKAFVWLVAFSVLQLIVIAIAYLPRSAITSPTRQ